MIDVKFTWNITGAPPEYAYVSAEIIEAEGTKSFNRAWMIRPLAQAEGYHLALEAVQRTFPTEKIKSITIDPA